MSSGVPSGLRPTSYTPSSRRMPGSRRDRTDPRPQTGHPNGRRTVRRPPAADLPRALARTMAPSSASSSMVTSYRSTSPGRASMIELGLAHFGQHRALAKPPHFPDQQAAGLSESFNNQRCGHDRKARHVVVQLFFGQGHGLFGRCSPAALEFHEPIDPEPSHAAYSVVPTLLSTYRQDR